MLFALKPLKWNSEHIILMWTDKKLRNPWDLIYWGWRDIVTIEFKLVACLYFDPLIPEDMQLCTGYYINDCGSTRRI